MDCFGVNHPGGNSDCLAGLASCLQCIKMLDFFMDLFFPLKTGEWVETPISSSFGHFVEATLTTHKEAMEEGHL